MHSFLSWGEYASLQVGMHQWYMSKFIAIKVNHADDDHLDSN